MPLIERLLSLLMPYLADALIRELSGKPALRRKLKAVLEQHEAAETDEELGDAAKAWQSSIRGE